MPRLDPKERLLTLDEAAAIAGRSKSWARYRRQWGPLEPAEIDGRHAVTARSVEAYLATERAKKARQQPKRRAPKLRLVWSHPEN